jgi:hypothetical protein
VTATLTKKALFADVRIKDADQGVVELVFATFNKVDKDGDVTLKGAFEGNPPVVLSAYGHKSWDGELPLGTGTIREDESEAVAEVKFLLDTTHGRDAFLTVKALSDVGLQEWSYSLEDVKAHRGDFEGKNVRFLERIFVKEISPVLRGAGTDTRTLDVKSDDERLTKFSEQADAALRGVKQLVEMAVERLPLRAAEGKSISEQTDAYGQLMAELERLKQAIDDVTQPPPPADDEIQAAVDAAYLEYVALSQGDL